MKRIALASVLALTSCLSAGGERVIVTYDRADVQGCKLIKRIKATAGTDAWGAGTGPGISGDENSMRSQTAKAGGNVTLAVTDHRAEAYLCPADVVSRLREGGPLPTPTPAAAR